MSRPAPPRISLLFACLILAVAASGTHAETYTVTIESDLVAADLDCSLREAILAANADATNECSPVPVRGPGASPPHTIVIPEGDFSIQIGGLLEDSAASGDFDLTNPGAITIQGAGADLTRIHGGGLDRIFDVFAGTVQINDVSILGGNPQADGGAIRALGGFLTLNRSAVSDSYATGNIIRAVLGAGLGGGIYTEVDTYIYDSEISFNEADLNGAGIFSTGYTQIHNTTISNNFGGYAVVSESGAYCTRCRLSVGSIELTNSTVRENSGGFSEGESGSVYLNHTIVVGNGEFEFDSVPFRASLPIDRDLTLPIECDGGTSNGYNAFGQDEGCPFEETDLSTTWDTFAMGPLFDNGGPTATHALYPGNPAIGAGAENFGDRGFKGGCPEADQREFYRHEGNCDIGAFGVQTDFGIELTNGVDGAAPGETVTYTATIANAYGKPTDGMVFLPLPDQVEDCSVSCSPTGTAACIVEVEEPSDKRIIFGGDLIALGYIFSVRGDDTVEITTTCAVRDEMEYNRPPGHPGPPEEALEAAAWVCAVDFEGFEYGCREPFFPIESSRIIAPDDEFVIDWVPTNDLAFDIDELLPSTSDLVLTLTDLAPGDVVAGTQKTLHVTVENNGPSIAHDTFVDFVSSPFAVYWDDTCENNLRRPLAGGCYLGSMAVGETREFDFTFEIHSWAYPLSLSVLTEVTSSSVEGNPGDESDSLVFTPLEADDGDFTFELTGTEDPVTDVVEYVLTIMNESDSHIAQNAGVWTVFDDELSCVWTCTPIYGSRLELPDMETSCSANGVGNINEGVSIRSGDGLEYTATCTTSPAWDDSFLTSEASFEWQAWDREDNVLMTQSLESFGIYGIFEDGFESGDKTGWDFDIVEPEVRRPSE